MRSNDDCSARADSSPSRARRRSTGTDRAADGKPAPVQRLWSTAPWLWGAFIAAAVCRFFFTYGPGDSYFNHEGYRYIYRIVEFLASLKAGYAFPQWAVDFRSGLGSPYFSYYQPGFFYVAAAFA